MGYDEATHKPSTRPVPERGRISVSKGKERLEFVVVVMRSGITVVRLPGAFEHARRVLLRE